MLEPFKFPLSLVPAAGNNYPLRGILVRGAQPETWLTALLRLKLPEHQVLCYAIPDRHPNQIWGCLIVVPSVIKAETVVPYVALQCAHEYLFLPENSQLSPCLEAVTLARLLFDKQHLLHPTLGLVELFDPLEWAALLLTPAQHQLTSRAPEEGLPIPDRIRIVTVEAAPIEESLGSLDALVPEREDLQGAPLTATDIFRLRKLRTWRAAHFSQSIPEQNKGLWVRLQDKIRTTPPWTDALQAELDALEQRYQDPMNRLMNLLKEDPEKALRYAIPLNTGQIGRGYGNRDGGTGTWDWTPRWAHANLSQGDSGYSSGSSQAVPNQQYYELQRQYEAAARTLIKQGKYDKAAFIYLRLLRTPKTAVETLVKGQLYEQAASVYLKYLDDEPNAAHCYEQSNRLEQALLLYKKLDNFLKIGDLYHQLGQEALALDAYEKVLERLITDKKYYQAVLFCEKKLQDAKRAYALSYTGWFHGYEAIACLQYCLNHLPDLSAQRTFLEEFYAEGFADKRLLEFFKVLRYWYEQHVDARVWVRALAYLAITDHAAEDINWMRQLLFFNDKDIHLSKDILRHRLFKRK